MRTIYFLFILLLILLLSSNCQQGTNIDHLDVVAQKVAVQPDPFKEYWHQGKAELTSYVLEQARYGEIHQGEAVLIFVTEDFSKSKLVKLDKPSQSPKDAVNVLKLNLTKKFNTGIYPYSIMQSTFTPVDYKKYPNSLKVTTSSQEWCGHTFMQANLKGKTYKVQQNSYFESEGDATFTVAAALLEDEIWTRIRINPNSLPTGMINILPGTIFSRLRHASFKPVAAKANMSEHPQQDGIMQYHIDYPDNQRSLTIDFVQTFPHEIIGWEETFISGFGANTKSLTTRATKKQSILLDYWNKHDVADLHWRKKLGLQ